MPVPAQSVRGFSIVTPLESGSKNGPRRFVKFVTALLSNIAKSKTLAKAVDRG